MAWVKDVFKPTFSADDLFVIPEHLRLERDPTQVTCETQHQGPRVREKQEKRRERHDPRRAAATNTIRDSADSTPVTPPPSSPFATAISHTHTTDTHATPCVHLAGLREAQEEAMVLKEQLHLCSRQLAEERARAAQHSLAMAKMQHDYETVVAELVLVKSARRQLEEKHAEAVEQTVKWRAKVERMRVRHQQQLKEQQRAYEHSLAEHVEMFARVQGGHAASEQHMRSRAAALAASVQRVEAHLAALGGLGEQLGSSSAL